jgi:hypothetical protein
MAGALFVSGGRKQKSPVLPLREKGSRGSLCMIAGERYLIADARLR